ncbi:glycosyltransferase family 4 protein [Terrilactibacillus laevilacticus]|uniref:glycosyltransferase family 4 protein n=1 Tax=Terrilactibacillus laevilacticus TaxID=1380157 RepID=UPI0011465262|nr:glycosyltransferase family 4 protein [Terrilactibacillus laevilacticus]
MKIVYYVITKLFLKFIPDQIIVNSKYTMKSLNSKKPCNIVYPSVDISMYNNISSCKSINVDSDQIVITMVGRIAEWKGQHIFIQAAEQILNKKDNVIFLIAGAPLFGEEKYFNYIKNKIKEFKLSQNIQLLGHVNNIPELLNSTDISVHCSIEPEPFGQVIIQSMAAGKPVIASAHGGPLEIINNGYDGLLIVPENPTLLANTILELIDNNAKRKFIGANAKIKANNYDIMVQDKAMISAIKNTINY